MVELYEGTDQIFTTHDLTEQWEEISSGKLQLSEKIKNCGCIEERAAQSFTMQPVLASEIRASFSEITVELLRLGGHGQEEHPRFLYFVALL